MEKYWIWLQGGLYWYAREGKAGAWLCSEWRGSADFIRIYDTVCQECLHFPRSNSIQKLFNIVMIAEKSVKNVSIIHNMPRNTLLTVIWAWFFYLTTMWKTREVFSYIHIPLKPVCHTQAALVPAMQADLHCCHPGMQGNPTTEPSEVFSQGLHWCRGVREEGRPCRLNKSVWRDVAQRTPLRSIINLLI